MARHYFSSSNVLGAALFIAGDQQPTLLIGVVKDVKFSSPYEESAEMIYLPLMQQGQRLTHDMYIEARADSSGAPAALSIRTKIAEVMPSLEVPWIENASERLNSLLLTERLSAGLALAFSVISVALACIGIYAVTTLAVKRRTAEIGLRMALGASRLQAVRFVMNRTLWFVLLGLALGIPCALAGGHFLSHELNGLSPAGPALLSVACLCALALSAAATVAPAARAAWIDPLKSLRNE
jgi:ABC-type lipoprotein release transport system permease subunit